MNEPINTPISQSEIAPSGGDSSASQATATPVNDQTSAADAGAGSQTEKPPHESAPADQAKQPTLTSARPVASNTQAPDVIDPASYKALRDEKSTWGRQMAETRRQYEETRTQLARLQQEREQTKQLADHQKLALHDFRHPEHQAKFQPILAKADMVRQQIARINSAKIPDGFTPEQGALWKQSQQDLAMSALSDDEQNALEQFQSHSQNFDRQWKLNPAKTLTEHVIPMIRQEMQRAQMEMKASQEVDQDFSDPNLGPILKEFQPQMADMIQKLGGTDEAYDFAKHHAQVYAQNKALHEELARLKQQNGQAQVQVGVAATQQALAKGKASITRDVVPRHTQSPFEVATKQAAKQGISTSSPAFFQLIREIEAEQASRK